MHTCTVWKNEKFSLTDFFRQINYLVISLVKLLFSRIFCGKSVRGENFCNFHTVWKIRNFTATIFSQKIPWNQLFVRELYSKLIWQKNCMAENFSFFHTVFHTLTVWKKSEILSHIFLSKISWKQWFY